MNYRIEFYETFDGNGVSIITLFFEINNQIYQVTKHFIKDKDKNKTISECFLEMSKMLKGEL